MIPHQLVRLSVAFRRALEERLKKAFLTDQIDSNCIFSLSQPAQQLLLRGGRGRLAARFGCVSVSLRSTGVEMIVPFGMQYLTLWQSLAYPEDMSEATTKALRFAFPPARSRRVMHFRGRGASLGLGASNTAKLIEQVERGFSYATLQTLEFNSGLALPLLASIIGIPQRTLARRKTAGKLAPDESERLLRISNLFEKCVELFEGDVTAAVNWLTTPKKALNQAPPLMYARTEFGAREVEDLIGRLEHGVFS